MRYLRPFPPITIDDEIRFWSKVIRKSPQECWLWVGTIRTKECPSPSFHLGDYDYIASRVAYAIHYKQDPGANYVLHKCDNPFCMNPEHLFLGDQFDNMQDAATKHRLHNRFVDEACGREAEIKSLYRTGDYTIRSLAKHLKINYSAVRRALQHP